MQEPSGQPVHFGGGRAQDRPVMRSIGRGMRSVCPACGTGKLFRAFLKPVDQCAACGEEIHHHRADDLPAYLVIFIVGHVLLTGYMLAEMVFVLSPWAHIAIWGTLAVVAALLTIQPIKGGVIGLQWAYRMHGFGGDTDEESMRRHGGPSS
ncbi:MAG TPA: DUF983 domain-containing protein [Pseudorhizobium sp.]|nr:DUF983 domain-containing protein [Pseudorhizobium sp.]